MNNQGFHIDVGVAILATIVRPGETVTHQQIADVCGCSKQRIFLIEKAALFKLRSRLSISEHL